MMRATLAGMCLGALVCVNPSAGAEARVVDGVTFHFEPGFEADVDLVQSALFLAVEKMDLAFPRWHARTLILTSSLEVTIYAAPNEKATEARTLMQNGSEGERYSAHLHLLAPSRVSLEARTSVGEIKDRRYFEQLMVHELSTIVFDRVTRGKALGWRIYSAPNWFVQGLEQYLALSLTGADQALEKYLARTADDPRIVQTDFGIHVSNDYTGGTALLAFICRDGLGAVERLLMSDSLSFGLAMQDEFDMDVNEFGTQFSEWLKKGRKAPNKPVETTSLAHPEMCERFPFAVVSCSMSHG